MKNAASHYWVGTSGYQYPEWKGSFYPEKIPVSKMLPYYAERFPTTEVNYSFRRIPSSKTIANWVASTPDRFRFTLKAPQKVTHFAKLRDTASTVAYFHKVMLGFGEKRGIVLFQLPPTFDKDAPLLASFLETMPKGMRAAFEFRHASWFDEDVFAHLKRHGAALCHAESIHIVTPREVTADFGYLRLRLEDYTPAKLKNWAAFIRKQEGKWREVFIYFKHETAGVGPKFARQMMKHLGVE